VDEDENEPAPSPAHRPDSLPPLLTNFLLPPLLLDEMSGTKTGGRPQSQAVPPPTNLAAGTQNEGPEPNNQFIL
jgi:hypothetical protein